MATHSGILTHPTPPEKGPQEALLLLLLSRFSHVRFHRPQPTRLPRPWDSSGKNSGVGCHFLLQCVKVQVKSLRRVRLLATPWTAVYQAPPSMGFSRQEYWSRVPLPSPPRSSRGLANPGHIMISLCHRAWQNYRY